MIKDLVSIVVPTYNDEKYLEDAINDLLRQTYTNIEIIIVNDGSTDGTSDILSDIVYRNPNKKIFVFNKENGGTGSALNVGFRNAQGEFATWVSSDDRKNADFVETLVTFLKENRDIELVVSAFKSDYVGAVWRPYQPSSNVLGYITDFSGTKHDSNPTGASFCVDNWVDLNNAQCHMGVNYMFTMALKNRCGDYLCIPGEDYYMAVKMGLNTRVGYVDKVLGKHSAPPDSLSMTNRMCVAEANRLTRELIKNHHSRWYLSNIPKVVHCYFGCSKMSYLRARSIVSFKQMNPDWSVILYQPKQIIDGCKPWVDQHHRDDKDYFGEDFSHLLDQYAIKKVVVDFDSTPLGNNVPEAHKSDFLRWFLLYKHGGFWMDSDILFYRPMTSINLNESSNTHTTCILSNYGIGPVQAIQMNCIGFLGSSKNCPVFVDAYKEALELSQKEHQNQYQTYGVYILNKLFTTFQMALVRYPSQKILNLDEAAFYNIDFKHLEDLYCKDSFEALLNKNNTMGIHWYGGAPISQKYNNLYPRDTKENTIDSALNYIEQHTKVVGN